jgi:hypothetical protein
MQHGLSTWATGRMVEAYAADYPVHITQVRSTGLSAAARPSS